MWIWLVFMSVGEERQKGEREEGDVLEENWFRNNIRKACNLEKSLSARSWDSELYAYFLFPLFGKIRFLVL